MRNHTNSEKNSRVVWTVFVVLSFVFSQFPSISLASSPSFTNNGAVASDATQGTSNNLVFDLTLPPPDTDVFLDGDGTATTGAGSAESRTAGDVLKVLAMAGSTVLCGNTNGTSAPSTIVLDADGGCSANDGSTVDSTGSVGQYASLQLDTNGFPVVSYYDGGNGDLKILHCNDADCAGADESIETVDSTGLVGFLPSLRLDASGFPVVAYWDLSNDNLKILHCNDVNCAGGNESISAADSTGSVGTYASLQLDASGFPVVSYYDETNGNLKILHCNDVNCSGGNESITAVDSAGDVGWYTSLELDASGFPVVSYFDSTNTALKILHCNDVNCSGGNESISAVDSTGNVGLYTSLELDGSGNPVVSYTGGFNLKVLHCNDVNCSGGNESIVTVDSTVIFTESTSLRIDSSGYPVVSYYDNTNSNLKVLHCNDVNCAGADESVVTVDSTGNVGQYPSLRLDSSGFPVVSYWDATNNDLKVVHCDDINCADTGARTVILGSDFGEAISLVSSISRITFSDTNADDDWDSGEDLYFDTDKSGLYNADTLDATTLANTGNAVSSTDITTVKLWQDDGDASFSAGSDTSLDSDCSFNVTSSNWECDVAAQVTAAIRVFLTADLDASATVGRTLIFQVPAKSDTNSNGAFNTGDKGIYFASDHDGPTSALTNANTQTIISSDSTAPVFSSVSSTPASTTASITWTTDELASSIVDYGLTSSYGSSTSESDTSPRVTSHTVSLSSLVSCATYHYRVRSKDANLNQGTGTDNTFTTTGCTGSSAVVSQASSSITRASGGTVSLTTLSLAVPASFAASDATFQTKLLSRAAVLDVAPRPTGKSPVGSFFQLSALTDPSTELSSFLQPITITLSFASSDVAGLSASSLKIYRWNGSSWSQLSGCISSSSSVTCTTTAFSTFGIFGEPGGGGGLPTSYLQSFQVPSEGVSVSAPSVTSSRKVTLSLQGGSDAARMAISSQTLDLSDAGQEPYAATKEWDLCSSNTGFLVEATCPLGNYTVTVQYYTFSGQPSPIATAKVTYNPSLATTPQASQPGIAAPTPPTTAPSFTRDLFVGSTGEDVKLLQEYLNTAGFLVAESGPGSPGQETERFGSLTKQALIVFQEAHASDILAPSNLKAGTGYFGPSTRSFLSQEQPSSRQAAPAPERTTLPVPTSNLSLGSTGQQVLLLQTLLASDPELYPEALITGYYGPLTTAAVQRFQLRHKVASEADPGFGYYGPRTRGKMGEDGL